MKMYEIIYINKKWNGKCVMYGFKPFIKEKLFEFTVDTDNYEILWVLPLSKTIDNFKKCLKKTYIVLEKFSNIY